MLPYLRNPTLMGLKEQRNILNFFSAAQEKGITYCGGFSAQCKELLHILCKVLNCGRVKKWFVSYCFDFSNIILEHSLGGREVSTQQWSTTPNKKCKFEFILKTGIPSAVTTLLNKKFEDKSLSKTLAADYRNQILSEQTPASCFLRMTGLLGFAAFLPKPPWSSSPD